MRQICSRTDAVEKNSIRRRVTRQCKSFARQAAVAIARATRSLQGIAAWQGPTVDEAVWAATVEAAVPAALLLGLRPSELPQQLAQSVPGGQSCRIPQLPAENGVVSWLERSPSRRETGRGSSRSIGPKL
jgi:hypothetical protein